MRSRWMSLSAIVMAMAALFAAGCSAESKEKELKHGAILERIEQLEHEIGIQRDIEEIRRLQFAYNYYNSNGFQEQLIDLIAEDAESIEIGGQGIYHGKDGYIRNFGRYREDGEVADQVREFGRALVQLAGMQVITVADDRQSAKARLRVLTPILSDFPDTKFRLNAGDYEMGFIVENGQWKISRFKYVHIFSAHFNRDGTITPSYSSLPNGKEDAPTSWYHPFPEVAPLPFHFTNPVTGESAPELRNPTRYWIGNWPGEFGQSGHHEVPQRPGAGDDDGKQ